MESNKTIAEMPGYWLILDASCPTVKVALFQDAKLIESAEQQANAMDVMLTMVQQLIKKYHLQIQDINYFSYCIGPGSILGVRLSIMAIKTWCSIHNIKKERVFTYESLRLVQSSAKRLKPKEESFIVLSEWKKNHWNVLTYGSNVPNQEIQVWSSDDIDSFSGGKYLLPQKKIWSNQAVAEILNYQLDLFDCEQIRIETLRPLKNWEVYTPEQKEYVRWSKDRHR